MIDFLWSALITSFLGVTTAAHTFGCSLFGCVHFLDYEYTPIVYTLDKDGLRSYAVGTSHATISREQIPRVILHAINAVPTFVNELSQTEAFPMDLLSDPDGRKLKDVVAPTAWNRLTHLFPQLHRMPATVRPMVVYRMYTERVLSDLFGSPSPRDLLEPQLLRHARDQDKEVHSLASLRDVVATLGEAITPGLLDWSVTELDSNLIAASFEKQRAAFRAGDLNELVRLRRASHHDLRTEILFKRLIVDRNKAWAPRIVDLHAQGPFTLVIGAGHLGGDNGLVTLLNDAGFRVRRLPHPPRF